MRRRVRWFFAAVAVCLAASGGFYAGTQYADARFLKDQLAIGTTRKVKVLQELDGRLPDDARAAMAAELPALVARLDEALTRPSILFVDYKQVKEARDLGVAYLKAYPPTKTAALSSRELQASLSKLGFYMNPSADGWKRNEEIAAAEERVDQLLASFDPAQADPQSRAVYESLSKSGRQGERESPQQHPPNLQRPAAK